MRPTRHHWAPPSPQLRFARWEMGLSVCSSSSACLCKSTQRLFKEIRAKLKLHLFWPTRRAMEIGHCLIYVNGADFCCCITFPDRQWTSILTQVTSLAGLATWVRLSAVNVLGFHLLSDSSIWQKHPFPKARACHILASTDVFHNGKCAILKAGKAEILLWKCVCLTCWVL